MPPEQKQADGGQPPTVEWVLSGDITVQGDSFGGDKHVRRETDEEDEGWVGRGPAGIDYGGYGGEMAYGQKDADGSQPPKLG